jgi:hypothetical protein
MEMQAAQERQAQPSECATGFRNFAGAGQRVDNTIAAGYNFTDQAFTIAARLAGTGRAVFLSELRIYLPRVRINFRNPPDWPERALTN